MVSCCRYHSQHTDIFILSSWHITWFLLSVRQRDKQSEFATIAGQSSGSPDERLVRELATSARLHGGKKARQTAAPFGVALPLLFLCPPEVNDEKISVAPFARAVAGAADHPLLFRRGKKRVHWLLDHLCQLDALERHQ